MYIVAYFMKNLGFIRKPLTAVMATAITLGAGSALADEDVRLPTEAEMKEIKATYEKTFGMNLQHVRIFYNEPKLSHKGPVGAIRTEKLNACGVVINSKDWQTMAALSFMKGAPNQEVARNFLVAHELTHCLFTREDSMKNVTALGLDISEPAHSQEVLADLAGTAFVLGQGADQEQTLAWLKEKRSGYIFNRHYNTAQYLNAETINRVEGQLKNKGSDFSFFSENKLFNVGQPITKVAGSLATEPNQSETAPPLSEEVSPQKSSGMSM